ncbi:MAG: DsbA family protein [Solirubrobacteraceae bacterium]
MGNVIYLAEHRAAHQPPVRAATPEFFFDVSCPLSYLTAERVERTLGDVEWVPVDGAALCDRGHAMRARADASARALRLPLVWPDDDDDALVASRCAQRASSFACEIGAGAAFALAASRLAFCGGFDLDDPETLAEAAAAAGVPLEECLAAAGEAERDEALHAAAQVLRANDIEELPAIRIGDRWFQGDTGLMAAAAVLSDPRVGGRRLAPV